MSLIENFVLLGSIDIGGGLYIPVYDTTLSYNSTPSYIKRNFTGNDSSADVNNFLSCFTGSILDFFADVPENGRDSFYEYEPWPTLIGGVQFNKVNDRRIGTGGLSGAYCYSYLHVGTSGNRTQCLGVQKSYRNFGPLTEIAVGATFCMLIANIRNVKSFILEEVAGSYYVNPFDTKLPGDYDILFTQNTDTGGANPLGYSANTWYQYDEDFNIIPPGQKPEPTPDPDDPDGNVPTDTQNPGGYDPDSDDIPFGVQNWLNASDLGLCTVYNPTVAQVQALATRLYSKDFWSGFENYLWGNPVESILGLSVVPCAVPDGGQGTVKSWGLDTGVTMTLAGNTLVHVDCGQLPVPKLYETYLDWSPYTIAEIYVPYVGFVGLDVDDIMGQNLQLHYYIDIISCSAICQLVISNTSTTTVLGQWSCQVGRQIPVGSKDYNDIINAGIQLVASTVSAVNGNILPMDKVGNENKDGSLKSANFAVSMLRAGSSAIMQAKPNITRGAAIANASGQLAVQYPYLILKRPVAAQSNGYGALVGFPTFKYGNIGSYTGYVRCHNIKLDGIAATDWELSEIFRLCCEGVYI